MSGAPAPEPRARPDFTIPGAPQRIPSLPANFTLFTFDGFEGLNTKATRPAIGEQQCAWLDNMMPLGRNNLRTMYDVGDAIYTASGGRTVTFFGFANIADAPICMVVLSDGSIVQVNTSTLLATTVSGPGTIASPTSAVGLAQWGSQYVLLVTPQTNGFFMWDGTTCYRAGTLGAVVTLAASGGGYTGQPTMTAITGTSSGGTGAFLATLTSSGTLTNVSVTNAGSGYSATSAVVVGFSGGGSNTTAIAYASVVGGRVTNVSVLNAGSGYTAAAAVEFLGGGGFGASAAVTASGGVSAVTIQTPGEGYITPPTLFITDPNNAVAQASVNLTPFGVQGTCLETYTNRVWVGNGHATSTPPQKNLVTFTAPAEPAGFGDVGAGAFLSTDSFLRVGYHFMKQSNGFLYLGGDSSINYISGVSTDVNGITTFSNQNVDPQVGTPWPLTAQVFGRAIVFANTFGVHSLYGGAVQKVSGPLDGLYTSVTPTGTSPSYNGLEPSSAVAVIFGIDVYILLLPIVDAISNMQRNALLCWDGQRWWTASQSVDLIQIASQEINSVLKAYGTDGSAIYPLFQTASTALTKTVQSKLWDDPTYVMVKHSQNVQGIFKTNTPGAIGFTLSVDTEAETQSTTQTATFAATWTTAGGLPVSWTTPALAPVTWLTQGLGTFLQRLQASGQLMGLTFSTTHADFTLVSLLIVATQDDLKL